MPLTNLQVMNSSYVGSCDLWWVDVPEAVKGYNIYRAHDYPANWHKISVVPVGGHFYRDMTSLSEVVYTVKDSDWIERGELGRWIIRIPDHPFSRAVQGRPIITNDPTDLLVTVSVSGDFAIDGQSFYPTKVDGFDRTLWLKMDNTLPEGGGLSALPLASNGVVWQADWSAFTAFQVTYYKVNNLVDIYTALNRTYYCYSDDTEVFTQAGWKLFKNCQQDDIFATRRINTKEFEWQSASGFFKAQYDGNLLHFYGQSLDQLVTPNHRMLVNSLPDKVSGGKRPKNKCEHIVEAEKLIGASSTNTGIATTSVWMGKEIPEMVFGGQRRCAYGPVPTKISLSGDDFCALMGMYLAEGSIIHDNKGFTITQPSDARGSRSLYSSLLIRLFGKKSVWSDDKDLVVHSVGLGEYLCQFGHAHEKFIPNVIREASSRQLEIFWKYYYAGDGAACGDTKSTQQAFTVSKLLADQLTEIIQKIGSSSTVYTKSARDGEILGRKISCKQGYFISRHRRSSGYTANWKIEKIKYRGMVYCVSVPNMFLYVRRNGKACWSGNTVVPVGADGHDTHEPGARDTIVKNTQEVDQITWEYEEMVRRNQWLFEQVGEPAYLMFRKWRGEPCGCLSGTQQPKTGCRTCYETGFVGGYIGPYDVLFVPPDSALIRELDEGGIKTTRDSRSFLTRTPIVQNGDLVIRRNGDRNVINNVVYKMPRGIILQQDFAVSLLPPGDTRYLIPVVNVELPTIYNPVVRPDPLDGKGGGEPIFDPRTVPGKDWENVNIPIGRTIAFGRIQS